MKEKARVEEVLTNYKNANLPSLVTFQNGAMVAKNRNVHYTRLKSKKDDKIKKELVVANGMFYLGDVETDELVDNYICVRNKSTNKVRIIPIQQAKLQNTIYKTLEPKKQTELTTEETKTVLLKQFGGRKAARYADTKQNNLVNIDVLKNDLDATVEETSFVGDKEEKSTASYEFLRPPCNAEATQLDEIYNIKEILSEDLLQRLEEEAVAVYGTKVEVLPLKYEYLRSLIEKIQSSPQTAQGLLEIKVILYIDCLLNLQKSRVRNMKNAEVSGISEKLENDVRERFSDPNFPLTRTLLSTEKAICYIIVLMVLISPKYEIDANILLQLTNITLAKLKKFAHIGNVLMKPKTTIFSLTLPSKVKPLTARFTRKPKT